MPGAISPRRLSDKQTHYKAIPYDQRNRFLDRAGALVTGGVQVEAARATLSAIHDGVLVHVVLDPGFEKDLARRRYSRKRTSHAREVFSSSFRSSPLF
jgi:hypothetical protein